MAEPQTEPRPKKKRGRPKGSKNKPKTPEVVELPPEPSDDAASVEWAKAVKFAVENMNTAKMTITKAGGKLRHSMWQAAREFPKELLVNLMPKALAILDRNQDQAQAEVAEAERKPIRELEELLERAVAESQA